MSVKTIHSGWLLKKPPRPFKDGLKADFLMNDQISKPAKAASQKSRHSRKMTVHWIGIFFLWTFFRWKHNAYVSFCGHLGEVPQIGEKNIASLHSIFVKSIYNVIYEYRSKKWLHISWFWGNCNVLKSAMKSCIEKNAYIYMFLMFVQYYKYMN